MMKRMEAREPSRTGRSDEEARSSGSWLWAGSAQPEILTIRDLAAHLRVPVSTAYRLAQQQQLPGRKVGRQWRFSRLLLDAWLMSPEHRHNGAGPDGAFQPPVDR